MSKQMLEKTRQASEEIRQSLEGMLGTKLELHELRFAYARKDNKQHERSLGGVLYVLEDKSEKEKSKAILQVMYSDLSSVIGSTASDEIIAQPTKYSTPGILAKANEIIAKYSR
jgi:hypothetical protein